MEQKTIERNCSQFSHQPKDLGNSAFASAIGKISYDVSFISHSIWKIASHMLENTTNRYFLCWIMQTVSFVMSYANRVCLCSCFFNGSFFCLAAYLNISIRFKFESYSHFWDSVEALSWYSFSSIVFIRLSEISWCFCRTHFFACFPSVLYRIDNDVVVWCMRFGGFFFFALSLPVLSSFHIYSDTQWPFIYWKYTLYQYCRNRTFWRSACIMYIYSCHNAVDRFDSYLIASFSSL